MMARYSCGVSFLLRAAAVVHPDLDELGLHAWRSRRTAARASSTVVTGYGTSVRDGWPLAPGARPRDARTRRAKQRRAGIDLVAHAQRHVAPVGPAAVQIGTIHQIADADHRAEAVVGQALQMVDQILAREILLRHRAVPIVLIADVAVEVDLGRHHGLAGQVDARCAGRKLQSARDGRRAVNCVFSTRNAEFSIGALPSPVIRRAPSNRVALCALANEKVLLNSRHAR